MSKARRKKSESDELVLYISPKTAGIMELMESHGLSPEALLAAHPEISQKDLDAAVAEVMDALAEAQEIPGGAKGAKANAARRRRKPPATHTS